MRFRMVDLSLKDRLHYALGFSRCSIINLMLLISAALSQGIAYAHDTPRDITALILAAEQEEAQPVFRPTVLSDQDITLYRDIFALQEKAKWSDAEKKIAQVSDPVLMGYVRYQKLMHPTGHRSSFSELKAWMAYFADHPEADEIYSLALKRRPKRASNPKRPERRQWRQKPKTELHPLLEADYRAKRETRVRQIEGRVRYLIHKRRAMDGLKYIDAPRQRRDITDRQYDRMKSWVAASLYYQGYVDSAARLSRNVTARNGETAVMAYWISGLIAFRQGDIDRAYDDFSAMSAVTWQSDALRSGAAFWAARCALATGQSGAVVPQLEIAAQFPYTFYGQLALAQLGQDYPHGWAVPTISQGAFVEFTNRHPAARRAIALSQVGRAQEADLELRWLNGEIEDHEDIPLLAIANALDLPAAQIDIALLMGENKIAGALYPVPDFEPLRGFKTDRALLYALMRQESKFKTGAKSRVGARGLMQLMPRTASFIGRDRSLHRASGRDRLYDPAFNLELGQKYVNHLFDTAAKGNVMHMAVAYNGGPGNLRRWKSAMSIDDPLLFIESIPNTESRDFAENVLTNLWVYRARLGQSAPTRDRIAAGELPIFEAIDQLAGQ